MMSGINVLLAVVSFAGIGCALPPFCEYQRTSLDGLVILYGVKCSRAELADIPSDFPKSISYLDFEMDSFPSLKSSSFANYPRLQFLSLAICNIEHIERDTFTSLTELIYLDLSGNSIVELPAMPSSIQTLVLNSMTQKWKFFNSDRTAEEITSLKSLKILSLKGNDLLRLPLFVRELRNLDTLSVSRNRMTRLMVDDIAPLCSLQVLDFTNNVIARESACDCLGTKSWASKKGIQVRKLTCPVVPDTVAKKCEEKFKDFEYFTCKNIVAAVLGEYLILFIALLTIVLAFVWYCYFIAIKRKISKLIMALKIKRKELLRRI